MFKKKTKQTNKKKKTLTHNGEAVTEGKTLELVAPPYKENIGKQVMTRLSSETAEYKSSAEA